MFESFALAVGVAFALLLGSAMSPIGSIAEAAPPELWKVCDGDEGEPSGQRCNIPRGVAADPENGHVFVSDSINRRIVELNARGELIRIWGWDVVEGGGTAFEICVPSDTCKGGSTGGGAGQFGSPQGVAVDSAGSIYVVDRGLPSNQRVQKFDSNGNFVLMFGGDVNKTKVEEPSATESERNLCPVGIGDVCQSGSKGTGNGQFSWSEEFVSSHIAIDRKGTATDADDRIYVGDEKRIQIFDSGGHYLEDVPKDSEGALKDRIVTGLAVDASGDLYAIYRNLPDVRKIDLPSGKELAAPRFKVTNLKGEPALPTAVAVDSEGNLYAFGPITAAGGGSVIPTDPIFKFAPDGKPIEQFGKEEYDGESTGLATNLCPSSEAPGDLYVTNPSGSSAFVRAYGTEPVGCFKAVTLPASNVTEHGATLNGTVNPEGEAVTECLFKWGETTAYGNTAPCVPSAGEIGTGSSPVPVQADLAGLERGTVYHFRLIAKVGDETETGADVEFKTLGPPVISDEHVVGATDTEATLRGLVNPEGFATSCHFEYGTSEAYGQTTPEEAIAEERSEHVLQTILKGLAPGTDYHWRIVCANSSGTTPGEDRLLHTHHPPGKEICPNQAFRSGLSAFLPDCRAYEMVSPVEKNGGNILLLNEGTAQATPGGEKIAYETIPSFGDAQNSWIVNQYLATRTERGQPGEGWSSHGIHPPVVGRKIVEIIPTLGLVRDFFGFTPDLCSAWIYDYVEPSFTPAGQDGYADLYRRDNCESGEGDLEALMPEPPPLPQGTPESYIDTLRGVSEDGGHAVFVAKEAPLLPACRTGTAATTISFQWLRDGVPIGGATNPVYTPTGADAGSAIQCQVFAVNANAGSTQVANPAIVFPPEAGVEIHPPVAPASIAAPATSGTLTVGGAGGQTLTCNPGNWLPPAGEEGAPTFSYQWYRNGAAIAEATASTYPVSAADVASAAVFQCAVTGTNADGAVTKVSTHRATSPAPSPAAPAGNGTFASAAAIVDTVPSRVYDRSGGALHLVSVLPGGKVSGGDATVGGQRAVSYDGERVYWVAGSSVGTLFLRIHPGQGIVADECASPAKACTVAVSEDLTTPLEPDAFLSAASKDGAKALYLEGTFEGGAADLYEFDLNEGGEPKTRHLAGKMARIAGAGEDLSRIYFVSREALTGAAIAGAPNLYLDEGGTKIFVATLGEEDLVVGQRGFNPRVSPTGNRIVFQSRARLTGYDNTDAHNGKADVEVFSYEAGGELICISCNPTGARPRGRELRRPFWSTSPEGFDIFAAAWISAPQSALHSPNLISSDGNRVFFNSNDALLARDTNGTMDVYEWQAPGKGGCTAKAPGFFPQNGGCIDLISSGESPFESEFWEASESGDDVFFVTESSLIPRDPGLVDLYDARVNGGFPEAVDEIPCEGEACQSPPAPPAYETPASANLEGPGNQAASKPRKRCPKGRRRAQRAGKVRCVKKKRQASQSGRAGR